MNMSDVLASKHLEATFDAPMRPSLKQILEQKNLNNYIIAQGTDKNTAHPYVDQFYEKELAPYRDKPVNVLEIGICCGASVHLWHEYFQHGHIIGMDLVDCVLPEHRQLPRARYQFQDAYHPNVFPSDMKFDLIIDDGPHTFESQIWAVEFYLPYLAPGGLFVIEDIQNLYYAHVLRKLVPGRYKSEILDLRPWGVGNMDVLFVVRG